MKHSFEKLVNDIKRCRQECPWMKNQDLKKQKICMLDEAQEVADAIDNEDHENLREELGDLLYDTLHLIEIGVEQGLFSTKEVIDGVNEKIVRRKPWVFGDEVIKTPEEAVKRWNEIKKLEKEGKFSKQV